MGLNPQTMPMNREQRREHIRKNKNNPNAIFCPRCKAKTRHVAIPEDRRYSKEDNTIDGHQVPCAIICAACGNILRHNIKGNMPYEYVEELPEVVTA